MLTEDKLRIEIATSSPEVQMKFKDFGNEVIYCGFIFRHGKVFCRNLYTFDIHDDYKAEYLEVTEVFRIYSRRHSVIRICRMILPKIRSYYKESHFTFYITPLLATITEYHKPKIQHEVQKHNARYQPFITSNRKNNNRWWCNILCKSIRKSKKLARLARIKKKHILGNKLSEARRNSSRVPVRYYPCNNLPKGRTTTPAKRNRL